VTVVKHFLSEAFSRVSSVLIGFRTLSISPLASSLDVDTSISPSKT
jgi:hypothetical protein